MRQSATATVSTSYENVGVPAVVVSGDSDVYEDTRLQTTAQVDSGSGADVRLRGRKRYSVGEPGESASRWVTVSDAQNLASGDEPHAVMSDLEFDEYQWQARAGSGTSTITVTYHTTTP